MFQILRVLHADEAEEGMYGRQPYVACAGFVLAGRFEVLKERYDSINREVFYLKEGRILFFARGIFEEQLEAVAVAMEAVGAHSLLLWQVFAKEAVQSMGQRRDRSFYHGWPPLNTTAQQ